MIAIPLNSLLMFLQHYISMGDNKLHEIKENAWNERILLAIRRDVNKITIVEIPKVFPPKILRYKHEISNLTSEYFENDVHFKVLGIFEPKKLLTVSLFWLKNGLSDGTQHQWIVSLFPTGPWCYPHEYGLTLVSGRLRIMKYCSEIICTLQHHPLWRRPCQKRWFQSSWRMKGNGKRSRSSTHTAIKHLDCLCQLRRYVYETIYTCLVFYKKNVCKHALGILIRLKLVSAPPKTKSMPLGQKRKRGRPTKAKRALLMQ